MQHIKYFLLILGVVLNLIGLAYGEMYKWVDKNGVTHFGDTPPLNTTGKVESLPVTKPVASNSRHSPLQAGTRPEEPPVKMQPLTEKGVAPVADEANVEMFATSWCGYCRKAREFFHARGIPFVEYDIEADSAAAQRKREIDPRPGVPLVVINGQPIHGFVPQAYERALQAH